ncbi:hypothetical protein BJP36_38095 [Moorena producens JHB]|uniref:Uncharacterized protein n=1 Tax=Moorena producens (strain JHB) TaxID=1454205 RepID=A0A9Q9UWH4_MOOP1|nr:hypothetical protein [Moorena producens]WAN69906.1 hypothetical protein BJP36_38095 [Moorena producens JHB]
MLNLEYQCWDSPSENCNVNSCPLFPVPCSLFPTSAAKSIDSKKP